VASEGQRLVEVQRGGARFGGLDGRFDLAPVGFESCGGSGQLVRCRGLSVSKSYHGL
jgi:hypothetical protein